MQMLSTFLFLRMRNWGLQSKSYWGSQNPRTQTFLLTPSAPLKPCYSLPSSQSASFKNRGRSLPISARNPPLAPHLPQNKIHKPLKWLFIIDFISPLRTFQRRPHLRALALALPPAWSVFSPDFRRLCASCHPGVAPITLPQSGSAALTI